MGLRSVPTRMVWRWIGYLITVVLISMAEASYEGRPTSQTCGNACVKAMFKNIASGCFNTELPDTWDVFTGDTLDCTSIRKVLSIVPTCESCTHAFGSFSWRECYEKQKMACSTQEYCSKHCVSVKSRGILSCVAKGDGKVVSTPSSTTQADGSTAFPGGRHGQMCDDCMDRVPVSAAAFLFVLGLLIGATLTVLIFICVPCCQRKSNDIAEKVSNKIPIVGLSNTAERTATPSTANTIQQQPTQNGPIRTNACSSPTYSSEYHTLGSHDRSLGSAHVYSGIQGTSGEQRLIYSDPVMTDATYEQPEQTQLKNVHAVQSPVYNQFTSDDIVSGRGANTENSLNANQNTYQELSNRESEPSHMYGTLSSNGNSHNSDNVRVSIATDPSDTGNSGIRRESTGSGIQGHQYFILEPNTNGGSNS